MDDQTTDNTSSPKRLTDDHLVVAMPGRRLALQAMLTGGLAAATTPAFANSESLASKLAIDGEPIDAAETRKIYAKTDRSISLYNTHTRETMQTTFYSNGLYNEKSLHRLNLFLRDHRQNEAVVMDRMLFTQMWAISKMLETDSVFEIISGYRTAKTNEFLRGKSENSGVARNSYHMLGRAVDFRIREVATHKVRDSAKLLKAGGVGYYNSSNFVHIDTGDIRHWG